MLLEDTLFNTVHVLYSQSKASYSLFYITHCKEDPIYEFHEMKLRGLISQFPHSCICERFIYSHGRSTYLIAVSSLGIFILNFRYGVFAVQYSAIAIKRIPVNCTNNPEHSPMIIPDFWEYHKSKSQQSVKTIRGLLTSFEAQYYAQLINVSVHAIIRPGRSQTDMSSRKSTISHHGTRVSKLEDL